MKTRTGLRKRLEKGFTLIELMIVTAIIGILASFAIPAYNDYIARAQVSEAVTLLGGAKSSVADYVSNSGVLPSGATFADIVHTTSGRYTEHIQPSGDVTNIVLTATMRSTGVSTLIQGATLVMSSPDGGRTWTCTAGGTLSSRYRTAACRP